MYRLFPPFLKSFETLDDAIAAGKTLFGKFAVEYCDIDDCEMDWTVVYCNNCTNGYAEAGQSVYPCRYCNFGRNE